jgi:plasmid stabilization system protein ParE
LKSFAPPIIESSIIDFGYQDLRSGIRRALTRRFPYAVYFSIEGETVVVVAVLSTARDPEEWQRRI